MKSKIINFKAKTTEHLTWDLLLLRDDIRVLMDNYRVLLHSSQKQVDHLEEIISKLRTLEEANK